MSCTRSEIISKAQSWLGLNEYNGSHKQIIDIYNSHRPLARGYRLLYTDPWCAGTVSALAIACDATDILPTEVGCGHYIDLCKKMGIWEESDCYVPDPGDIVLYDWGDSGRGDNLGSPDHVGIVEKCDGSTITVIEGNYSNSVKRRYLEVNGRYIRGFAVPKYDAEDKPSQEAAPWKPTVKEWQEAAIKDGFSFPRYGADGLWGAECASVARNAVVKQRVVYLYPNLTKLVQMVVNSPADGMCGPNTNRMIREYQKNNGLVVDGCVGINTWKKILGV